MKKVLIIFVIFSLTLFPAPATAQGGDCVTTDFTTGIGDWVIDVGTYTPGYGIAPAQIIPPWYDIRMHVSSSNQMVVSSVTITWSNNDDNDEGVMLYDEGAATAFAIIQPHSNPLIWTGSQTLTVFNGLYGLGVREIMTPGNYITSIEHCWAAPPPPQTPTPFPGDEGGWIGITEVITLPYEFTPIDINTPSAPSLPLPDLLDVSFINQIGSIALTLMALFDQYQVLGIFVILLVAMLITFWLWTYVTGTPSQVTLKVSEGVNAAGQVIDVQNEVLQEGVNYYQDNALYLNQVDPYAHQRYLAAQGKIDSNKRLVSGMRQGAKLFRKAKKDFSGNPFK